MNRLFIPLILVIAAIGLFVGYTNPAYQQVKVLQAQFGQYDSALTQSSQVRQQRDQLLARRNTFSTDNIRRIERLLPDNVDNIRLIINIDDIAARYHLQVANVSLSTNQNGGGNAVGSGNSPLGSVDLSFSINATYTDFIAFLEDLERSLRIIDVEGIQFSAATPLAGTAAAKDPVNTYTMHIKTYWLR